MLAVYKREIKAYFTSMTGYLFIAFVLLFIGIYTAAFNLSLLYPAFEYVIDSTGLLYLIVIPILTMRTFAQERRQHTDQLLYSLPLPLHAVVLGKYLAMLTLLLIPTAIVCLYPLVLSRFGTMQLLTAYSAIFSFFLLGATLSAVGMFLSTLTDSQLIAAILCFGVLLLCFLMESIIQLLSTSPLASVIALVVTAVLFGFLAYLLTHSRPVGITTALGIQIPLLLLYLLAPSLLEGAFGVVLSALALFSRMVSFVEGIFDLTGVVYYVSVAGLFVFFTVQSLEKRRWS